MPQTFAYDLVGFLRVLYRRRVMIVAGTAAVTVLVAIAALIWPQTWRANARVLVSTPKYKETLRLVPQPFDVLTYQSVMASDPMYAQILDALKWYRQAIVSLQDNPDYIARIDARLKEKAEGMTVYEKMQNTNLEILSEFLIPPDEKDDPKWKTRVDLFGHLSAEELETVFDIDEDQLDDLTVFDLRKMLRSSVAKVRETNLEVEYSRVIQVSAEFDTAAGSKMLANTWLGLFLARAEEKVRGTIEDSIQRTLKRAESLSIDLATAETKLAEYEREANLSQLRAELASKLVQLTGMTPNRRIADRVEESFDLENENEPFMKERREKADSLSFAISSQYENALLPTRLRVENQLLVIEAMLKARGDGEETSGDLQSEQVKLKAELSALKDQIKNVTHEIASLSKSIRDCETKIEQLRRAVNNAQSALTSIRPLLDEAALMESRGADVRYADVGVDRAIKPDKRVFPKRTYMTAIGCVLSFFLWCCMAFFLDIWKEVVKEEE